MREAYSYRADAAVPAFPDDKPIIVFDGKCVLCSRWARFVMRQDPDKRFRLLAAQTPLGAALYRHYGLDPVDYETNVLIEDGRAWLKSESTIRMFERLGFPGSLGKTQAARCGVSVSSNRLRFHVSVIVAAFLSGRSEIDAVFRVGMVRTPVRGFRVCARNGAAARPGAEERAGRAHDDASRHRRLARRGRVAERGAHRQFPPGEPRRVRGAVGAH